MSLRLQRVPIFSSIGPVLMPLFQQGRKQSQAALWVRKNPNHSAAPLQLLVHHIQLLHRESRLLAQLWKCIRILPRHKGIHIPLITRQHIFIHVGHCHGRGILREHLVEIGIHLRPIRRRRNNRPGRRRSMRGTPTRLRTTSTTTRRCIEAAR